MQKKFERHASSLRGGRGTGKVSVHKFRCKFIFNTRTRATNTINKLEIAPRILLGIW